MVTTLMFGKTLEAMFPCKVTMLRLPAMLMHTGDMDTNMLTSTQWLKHQIKRKVTISSLSLIYVWMKD